MKKFAMAFLPSVLYLILCACTAAQQEIGVAQASQSPTWQEQYDLGVRYLSEGNYQEAILAFTAAIKIDPNRAPAYVGRGDAYVKSGETESNLAAAKEDYEKAIELDETSSEAYLGLADVYIRQGDYEKALEILERGLEMTEGDQRISNKIATVGNPYLTDNLLKEEDLTICGIPIYELNIQEAAELLQTEYPEGDIWEYEHKYHYAADKKKPDVEGTTFVVIEIYQDFSSDCLTNVTYCGWTNYEGSSSFFEIKTGIREISTGDPIEDVLRKLGFSDAGVEKYSTATSNILLLDGREVVDSTQGYDGDMWEIEFLFNKYTCSLWFANGKLEQVNILQRESV